MAQTYTVRNRTVRYLIFLAVVVGMAVASSPCRGTTPAGGCGNEQPNGNSPAGPRSTKLRSALVVSPKAASGGGVWVKKLLAQHGVAVKVVGWKKATVAYARKFDLIIVTGPERWIRGKVETGFDRPILAIGSYGYTYFGKLDLKNGYPYS